MRLTEAGEDVASIKLEKVYEEIGWVSDRLSTGVRTLAAGAIALVIGVLIQDAKTFRDLLQGIRWLPWTVGTAAVMVIASDVLQYFCGYFSLDALRTKMEREGEDEAPFPPSLWRLFRFIFFYTKMIAAAALSVLVVWMLVAMAGRVPGSDLASPKIATQPTSVSGPAVPGSQPSSQPKEGQRP
jgi:hypothetical protein